jgi:broad specificity phosphatase PhoE
MRLAEEDIQVSEALAEMSQGQWEGCHRSETYSGEAARLMEPDFSAPSGETLRQVEFRMVEFVNGTLPRRSDHHHHHHQHRKRSGKSRLQLMSTNHRHDDDDGSAGAAGTRVIGVFSHAVPIKCLLTGILGCGPHMSHKLCVDESSVTVLHHSWKTGWQIKKLNETAHLRLL